MATRKPCLEPLCNQWATGRGRCDEHRSQQEKILRSKDEDIRSVYRTKKWKLTRKLKLTQDPVCESCGEELATQVDHIEPLPHGAKYDFANLQSLCQSCHSKKTMKEVQEKTHGS